MGISRRGSPYLRAACRRAPGRRHVAGERKRPRRSWLALAAALVLLGCGAGIEERLARADRAFDAGNWSEAEAGYRRVLKGDEHNFRAHLRLAEVYFEKKRYDIMIGYHLREAERIMRESGDAEMRAEFRRVRGRILGKALESGRI
ncbi:hypothetical protein HS125_03020 [bacterium]|nr:hypothetical protein [bacterium]